MERLPIILFLASEITRGGCSHPFSNRLCNTEMKKNIVHHVRNKNTYTEKVSHNPLHTKS